MNDQFNQLVSYIKDQLAKGFSEAQIRQILKEHKWNDEIVNNAFQSLQTTQVLSQNVPSVAPSIATHEQVQSGGVTLGTSHQEGLLHIQNSDSLQPVKYKVSKAILDSIKALRNNVVAVVISVVATILVGGALLMVVSFLTVLAYTKGISSTYTSLLLLVVEMLIYVALSTLLDAVIYTVLISNFMQTMHDGHYNEKSNVLTVIRKNLSLLPRLMKASILVYIVSFWPLLVIYSIFIALAFSADFFGPKMILLLVGAFFGFGWAIIATLRYALVPMVALFETDVPISRILKRSKELLSKGGQWFLIKGILLTVFIYGLIGIVTGLSIRNINASKNIILLIITLIIGVFTNAVLVMLYINRKSVKANTTQL